MNHIERSGAATVPNLDARGAPMSPTSGSLLARTASGGPVALVLFGIVATALWAGFLAWCLFDAVRWLLG